MACTETATKLNKQAQLSLDVKHYDEAITLLKRAVVLEPENALTHCLLGMGYAAKEDFALAISEYKKALDITPNELATLCLLANLYLQQGMINEGITLSRKGIALEIRVPTPSILRELP